MEENKLETTTPNIMHSLAHNLCPSISNRKHTYSLTYLYIPLAHFYSFTDLRSESRRTLPLGLLLQKHLCVCVGTIIKPQTIRNHSTNNMPQLQRASNASIVKAQGFFHYRKYTLSNNCPLHMTTPPDIIWPRE